MAARTQTLKAFHEWAFDELNALNRQVVEPHNRMLKVAADLLKIKCPEAKLVLGALDGAMARLTAMRSRTFSADEMRIVRRARAMLVKQAAEQAGPYLTEREQDEVERQQDRSFPLR